MIFKLLMSAWTNKIPPCIAIRTYLFAWYPPPLAPPVARRIITDNICANEKSTAHVVAHFTTYKHHNPLDSARLQMLLFCVWGFQPENCDTASQNYLSFCLENIFVRKLGSKGKWRNSNWFQPKMMHSPDQQHCTCIGRQTTHTCNKLEIFCVISEAYKTTFVYILLDSSY